MYLSVVRLVFNFNILSLPLVEACSSDSTHHHFDRTAHLRRRDWLDCVAGGLVLRVAATLFELERYILYGRRTRGRSLSILPPSSISPTMDSVGSSDHLAPRNPNAEAIVRAAEKRNPKAVSVPGRTPRISRNNEFEPWDANHSMRLEFRRLLDPGILRNNDKKDAVKALRVRVPIDNYLP